MEEPILQVLVYLYEYYFSSGQEPCHDPSVLSLELEEAGFHSEEIDKAFDWIDAIADFTNNIAGDALASTQGMRIYSDIECNKLDADCRGLLINLEQVNILNPLSRELVIDRLMALETQSVSIEQMKWVALMIVSSQPDAAHHRIMLETMLASEDRQIN